MRAELQIPPAAEEDPEAFEIIRVWAAKHEQHVTIRWDLWQDPAIWGVFLADLAGHVANAFQEQHGKNPSETLAGIKEFFDKELGHPTNSPQGKVMNKRKPHRGR